MKITKSKLRQLIKEELIREINNNTDLEKEKTDELIAIFNNIKKEIIEDIPKFIERIDAKLQNRKYLKAELSNDDKKIINDFLNKTDIEVIDCPGCSAQYTWGKNIIEFDKYDMMTKEQSDIENTLYHEFYHALDSSYEELTNYRLKKARDQKDKLVKHRELLNRMYDNDASIINKSDEDKNKFIEKEMDEFEDKLPSVPKLSSSIESTSELFLRDIYSLRGNLNIMNNPIRWALKVEKYFPNNKEFYWVPFKTKTKETLRELHHMYTTIKDLRRVFPGKTLAQIAATSEAEKEKLPYWTKLQFLMLEYDKDTDDLFNKIATNMEAAENKNSAIV
jgi:ribosomal protein L29